MKEKCLIEDLDNGKFLNNNRVYLDRIKVPNGWIYRSYSENAIHQLFVEDWDELEAQWRLRDEGKAVHEFVSNGLEEVSADDV